jgi:hypothetical protein
VKILIEKEISAEVFMLMMEIGKAAERKDIISIVKFAAENGGELSPDLLCRELLNDRPENVGRTVLNRCCGERLMEWSDDGQFTRLTPIGEHAAETGVHYQAMREIYEIVYYDKGLLPCLIDCRGTGQSEFNKEGGKYPSFSPYEVNNDVKENLTEPISFKLPGRDEEIKVFSIARNGGRADKGKKLKISYKLSDDDKDELTLSGEIRGKLFGLGYTFKEGFQSVLKSVGRYKDWDSKHGYLKIRFSDLTSDYEKRNFSWNILEKTAIESYFCEEALDSLTITGVPVFPKSLKDAQEWFIWLLKNELTDYLEEAQYQDYSKKIRQMFGSFEDDLEIPDSQELAKIIKSESNGKIPDKYWYLVAPNDMRKVEV